jgi:hypothetical protein
MLADLDLLLIAVFATADDLLPSRRRNARRRVTDAEVVTLAVAQAIMDIPSDREFLAAAERRLCHLIPKLPKQPGYWKRRARLADTIDWLTAMFAQDCPGYMDDVVLVDSTPVECGRSVETSRRSELAPACSHHYSRSHSRWFWGMRLHLLAAPDGTPRAAILASADQKERDVALRLFEIGLHGGEMIVCDKGYAGRDFEAHVAERFGARILPPPARTSPIADPRCPGSANALIRSSGHSKTDSASNDTAPAASTGSGRGSPPSCSHSPLASGSTTTSGNPPERSRASPPDDARNQPSRRRTVCI